MDKKEYNDSQRKRFILKLQEHGFDYDSFDDFLKIYPNLNTSDDHFYTNEQIMQIHEIVREFSEIFTKEVVGQDNYINIDISYRGLEAHKITICLADSDGMDFDGLCYSSKVIAINLIHRLKFLTKECADAILNGDNEKTTQVAAKDYIVTLFSGTQNTQILKANALLLQKMFGLEKANKILAACDCLSINEIMQIKEDYVDNDSVMNGLGDLGDLDF